MVLNFIQQVHCAAACVEKINTARQTLTERILKLKVSHVRSAMDFLQVLDCEQQPRDE